MKVARRRNRFAERGLEGIEVDAYRPGRFPAVSREVVARIISLTTGTKPDGATHWRAAASCRPRRCKRIEHAQNLAPLGMKPHQVRTFKISNDPHFEDKLEDVVGLYLGPPGHALLLRADEKSQIQALDRTQPGLPLKRGRSATQTHDYKRNSVTTLFAPLSTADRQVIGTCRKRHPHKD